MTNFKTHISHKRFDQEKLITERLLFTIRIAHSKAETKRASNFLDNMYFNNTKALTKVTKDHQKKPKKPYNNYHLQQIDSYNQ